MALRTGSKSAALLWINGILATRAVAAIMPSNRHGTNVLGVTPPTGAIALTGLEEPAPTP
jgi:hypothetical protein